MKTDRDWQRRLIDPDDTAQPLKVWQVLLGWAVVIALGMLVLSRI
jgi:hypothetical protein